MIHILLDHQFKYEYPIKKNQKQYFTAAQYKNLKQTRLFRTALSLWTIVQK